jgi:hypothetical protein
MYVLKKACDASQMHVGANLIQKKVNGHKIQTQKIVWFLFCTDIPSTYSHNMHATPTASAVPQRQQDKRGRELSTFQASSIVNSVLTGDK